MARLKFAQIRDVLLLAGGLSLLGYETLGAAEPRWILVTIAAAMMGLPGALVADRLLVDRSPQQQPGPDPAPPESAPTDPGPTP